MFINLTNDVGNIIRDSRKLKGWNQTVLADKVGITQKIISKMENDPGKIDLGIILQVCAVLNLKLAIYTDTVNPTDGSATKNLDW